MENREIKFKVWDKINEEMIDFQKEWTVLEFDSGEVSNIVFKESEYYLGKDEFILMQYTGLHDKDGKEIYEGDILTSLYKFEGCGGVYEIIWKDAKFIPIKRGEHQQNGVSISMNDMTRCEVIGNIYENPELLNNKN